MVIIRDMAIEWWESKRPIDWTITMHIKHPIVNCATEAEKNLAKVIAAELK